MVTSSVDDRMKVFACFVVCKKFLFSDWVYQLSLVELLQESAHNVLESIMNLCQHHAHGLFLGCIGVYDEWHIWVSAHGQDGVHYSTTASVVSKDSRPQKKGASF